MTYYWWNSHWSNNKVYKHKHFSEIKKPRRCRACGVLTKEIYYCLKCIEIKENEMGFILVDSGSDFELIPEATYIATCVLLADLGTQPNTHPQGDGGDLEKLYIGFELSASDSKGVPFSIGETYTAAFGKKSNLRKMLEAWRGRVFTEEELKGFDIRNVLGKSCSIGVLHKPGKEANTKFPKIGSIQALPSGVPTYSPSIQPWIFDINQFNQPDYDRLPALAKRVLKDSYEFKGLLASGHIKEEQEASETADGPPIDFGTEDLLTEDDSIPF